MQIAWPRHEPDGRTPVVATWRTRFVGRLLAPRDEPDPERGAIAQPGAWFVGGEPTLRADLPELLSASPGSGLVTDGLALQSPAALRMLRERGLAALRIQLHSARPDAHDWLVGRAGAAKGAVRALRAGLAAGLDVQVHTAVTRPTHTHLVELVELVERLGVRVLVADLVCAPHLAQADRVALLPRRELFEPHHHTARAVASRLGVRLEIRGLEDADPLRPGTGEGATWSFDDEPSRGLRQDLVRLRQGTVSLSVTGAAAHPDAPALVRDCVRLFDHVDVTLTGSLAHWTDADLRQLRGLASLSVPDQLDRVQAENPSVAVRLR